MRHNNEIVIGHVPGKVCSICGDVLLKAETVRRIEELLETAVCSVSAVPLYEFAWDAAGHPR